MLALLVSYFISIRMTRPIKKLISATAFRLKGGGWYETDFKQDGKKNLHDSGKKEFLFHSKPQVSEWGR